MYNEHKRPIATGFHTEAKRAIVDAVKMATTVYELGERRAFIRNSKMVEKDAERYGFQLLDLTENEKLLVLDILDKGFGGQYSMNVGEQDRVSEIKCAIQRLGYCIKLTQGSRNYFHVTTFHVNSEMLDNIRKYHSILNIECRESFKNMINGWRFDSLVVKV